MQPTRQTTPQPQVIPLWLGGAPGSEDWTNRQESVSRFPVNLRVVRNVSQPTLTAYLPIRDRDRHGGYRLSRRLPSTSSLTSMKASRWRRG